MAARSGKHGAIGRADSMTCSGGGVRVCVLFVGRGVGEGAILYI